ncbi:MAG: phage tail tape measure protein [Oscillospiraceae bacterium]
MTDYNIGVGANTTQFSKDIQNAAKREVVTIKVNAEGKELSNLTKTTTGTINNLGELEKITTSVSKKNGQLASTTTSTTTSLLKMGKATKSIGADFLDTAKKVAKFGGITAIIGTFTAAVSKAVQVVGEFDNAITEFSKVSDYSREDIKGYADTLDRLGESVYKSKIEMLSAATEFKKSGFSEDDAAQLARVAGLYQNIADEELSASEASSVLISQMKAFDISASQSEHIINSINKVSNEFAVSSGDIGKGLTAAGAALSTYGNNFEEVIGLVTAGTEIFHGKSQQVARGLNTIAGRISKNEGTLKAYNVNIYDTTGALRSQYDILKDLAPVWDSISEKQKVELGNTLAGTNQYKIFAAVMKNFDTAIQATNAAYNSLNSAEEENAKQADTISAKTKALNAQFVTLVTGEGGMSSFLKLTLDIGTGALKLINNVGGLSTVLEVLAAVVTINMLPSLATMLVSFASTVAFFTKLSFKTIEYTIQLRSLSLGLKEVGITTSATTVALGALSAVVALGIIGWNAYKQSQIDAMNKAQDSISEFEKYNQQLQGTIDKINDETTSKAQLISTMKTLDSSYDVEKGKLQDINSLRQEAIDKLYAEAKAKAMTTVQETGSEYMKSKQFLSTPSEALGMEFETPKLALEAVNTSLEMYQKRIADGEKLTNFQIFALKNLEEQHSNINSKIQDATTIVGGYEAANKTLYQSQSEWIGSQKDSADSLGELNDVAEEQISTLQEISGSIDNIQSAYGTLTAYVDEYNSSQGQSIDTVQKLLELDPEYLALLSMENGQLVLNKQALQDKVLAQLETAKATIYDTAVSKLNALEQAKTGQAAIVAGNDMASATAGIDTNTQALIKNAKAHALSRKISGDEVNTVISDMENQLKVVDSLISSVGLNFNTSMSSASKSVAGAKSAVKELNAELKANITLLEKQKKDYEGAFEYIVDKIDEKIDKIKEEQTATDDLYDAQINDLKESQRAEEKYWNSKIEALNKQNDTIERQIELEQLQSNLAKAKSTQVLVLKNGKFEYNSDVSAVSKAQQELDDYNRKKAYEDELRALETSKERTKETIDEEIKDLERLKEASKRTTNEKIKDLERYKNEWKSITKNVKDEQSKIIAEMILGTSLEGTEWESRLSNASNYMAGYLAVVAALIDANNQLSLSNSSISGVSFGGGGGGTSGGGGSSGGGSTSKPKPKPKPPIGRPEEMEKDEVVSKPKPRPPTGRPEGMYANGINNVPHNQIAMVGDRANAELVIPSAINGIPTALEKGSGVIPSTLSENIIEISKYGLKGLVNNIISNLGGGGATEYNYNFDKLVLNGVQDPMGLINALKNFKPMAVQAGGDR